jgi:Protein kinase domain
MLQNLLFVGPPSNLLTVVGKIARKVLPDSVLKFHDSKMGQPGQEVLENPFDVVFLTHDLGLPGESGLAWLRELKDENIEGRLVVLVGAGYEVVRDSAIELGASACFATDAAGAIALEDWLTATRDRISDLEKTLPSDLAGQESTTDTGRGARALLSEVARGIEIPGYRLESVLASGGNAAIYAALSLNNKKPVALKILDMQGESNAEFIERFKRDYAALARLEHPHVNRIYDHGVAGHLVYFAMELCPRGDLRSKLRPMGIRPDLALDYLEQIAQGLGAAHSIGVLHRDLKPANILFREPGTLVVSDFGVARNDTRNSRTTRDQAILGTPLYISPEQIGDRQPDPRADLYSLGAMYYHLLTGDPPFKADSRMTLLEMHLNAPIPELPVGYLAYEPLIEGLLAKDPDDRFQSAEELLKGIDWVKKPV